MNNFHIITLYKLHNKLSCESCLSRLSCRACRASRFVLFDKLNTAKMHGFDTSNVSSRVVSRCNEPSGIWALENIVNFFKYFMKYFTKYFRQAKKIYEI